MSAALFAAGLGDVIRACYLTAAYRVLSAAGQPLPVLVASHNPFAIEIFRHHRNAKNFILYDLGHKYQEFLDAGLRGPDISRALCEFAGVDYATILRGSAEGHVPVFDAPDDILSCGHIVFQPFAGVPERSMPPALIEKTLEVLRKLSCQVFVLTRSYPRSYGGKAVHGAEDARSFAGGNVTVLENLTTPAALNLVKSCRAYVGGWSCLQQAAWLEQKPVAVFYPVDYVDVRLKTDYAFGMDRENTLGREFPHVDAAELTAFLRHW